MRASAQVRIQTPAPFLLTPVLFRHRRYRIRSRNLRIPRHGHLFHGCWGGLFVVTCFSLLGGWSTGSAQITPDTLPAQQPPVVISPIPEVGAPASRGISAKIITSATTNRLTPNFRSAGRGLPGMPGGPSLSSPLGARDPRPPTVGPLFCDPVVDFPC